jgi:hypothetical protein
MKEQCPSAVLKKQEAGEAQGMSRVLNKFRFAVLFAVLVLVLALLGGASVSAQTGRITGHVTDPQGAVIPDAAVQVLTQDSTIKRDVKTDINGEYSVPYLPAGNYRVLIQAPGFGSIDSQEMGLSAGQILVFNAQLTIASEKSEVTVSGGASTAGVELDTSSISTTIPSKEVEAYGLNGRNFLSLATMAPGVSNQTGQDEAKVGVAGSAKFSVNGGRVEYNTFEVDGSDVLNTSINVSRGQGEPLMVYPSIDAIDELKILTASYSALYGKTASGSVLVTTKSGSPAFHGNAYEFLRNEMFNARNYFDQPVVQPNGTLRKRTPLYRRQDFGFTLGGPVFIPNVYNTKKDKTFFFFSEEFRFEKTPVDFNQAVPTAAERQGDFSDVCPIFVPGASPTFNPAAYPDCPHAPNGGLGILPSRTVNMSYTGQAILNSGIIPEPNSTFGCNSTNPTAFPHCYNAAVSPPTFWREELFRIDHDLTSTQRLSFRYIHDAWNTTTLTPQWGVVQNSFPTVENRLDGPGLDMIVSLTQTLPHGFFNRLVLGYSVEHITLAPQPGPGVTSLDRPAMLDNPGSVPGWTPLADNAYCGTITGPQPVPPGTAQSLTGCAMGYIFSNGYGGNKMPGLEFQGTNGAYGGHGFNADTGYAPWKQDNPTYGVRDDVNKTVGKHNLQFGFEASYVRQNELSAVSGANSGDLQGLLTFSNQQSLYTSGNAFADFLSGPGIKPLVDGENTYASYTQTGIKSYTQDSGQGEYDNRYKMAELYLQDDWRVNSRFTVNFGFRGSFYGAWYNPRNTAYNWSPEAYNPTLGGSIYVDTNYGYLVRKTSYGGATPGTPVPLPNRTGPYSLSNLDPTITNGLTQCGVNGVSQSCMSNHPFHPAPRIGFAWDPFGDGKTAIRAGYGLYWEHGTGYEANVGSLIGSAPLVLSETESNVTGPGSNDVGAYNYIGQSCQGGTQQCGGLSSASGSVTYPLNVTSIPTKAVYGYTQQWSLSVQREIRKNVVGQVAYVGTKGTHLTAVSDLNQLSPLSSGLNPFSPGEPITSSVCSSGSTYNYFSVTGSNPYPPTGPGIPNTPGIGPTSPGYINMVVACTGNPGFTQPGTSAGLLLGISPDAVRPYPGFSNIVSVKNIAVSSYHALQATLREITGPLTIAVAYTYSHSLDDASDRSSANFANSLDLKSNYASSDFDQRHILNVSYQYDLPFLRILKGFTNLAGPSAPEDNESDSGKGRPLPAFVKTALGGWQLSGITTWQTGTPFSIINGGGSDGTGAADNAGVGDGLGIGSYVDLIPGYSPHGQKPYVAPSSANVGPLLYNPSAFAAPRGLTFGNSGRNSLNNPTRTNFNVSLFKHFKPVHERLDIEFRAEAFNVFNHTQFRIYDPSHPGNTGNNIANCYGDISTFYSAGASGCLVGNSFLHPVDAHDPRIMQFGLKGTF